MKKYKRLVSLLLSCIMLAGCGETKETGLAEVQADKTIHEISIPGILENCIDADAENLYYTVSGQSKIYQYTMDGTPLAQFTVTADAAEPEVQGFVGEKPADAADLSGLCMYEDTLYCFRALKNTLMAVDTQTGESRLCATMEESFGIIKMAAGEQSVLILQFCAEGKELWVLQTDTGVLEKVPVKNPVMIAHATEDTYWIEAYDEAEGYYFLEYIADTGAFSEKYKSNFTYELSDMTYSQETGLLYGRYASIQYVCLNPRVASVAARFTAQSVYESPAYLQMAGGRLYVQSKEEEKIYYFDPSAFITENKPLKGYVTSEFAITDWAGYNIELEVISWEELALKVLAEDKDYDFVIMSTDMAQATAIRDAMAYTPIPEEYVEKYWQACRSCVREAATYNGDIWMLPLNLYARGLVYSEENLAQHGISMGDMNTMEDLCVAANTLYEAGLEGRYGLLATPTNLLQEYMWIAGLGTGNNADASDAENTSPKDEISFDTPEFRALLDFIQGEYGTSAMFRNSYVQINAWNMVYDENSSLSYMEQYNEEIRKQAGSVYLEEVSGYSWDYEKYIGAEGIRVCEVPGLTAQEKPVMVSADIMIINPNSSNKEEALKFATAMSEAYLANPATYLYANPDAYGQDIVTQDVCKLYEQGEIVFGLPDDLFDIYWSYVWGEETDKEAVIEELNRTVNMYYGE